LSRPGALSRFLAAALLRNLIPYGVASVAAALATVACMTGYEASQGRMLTIDNLATVAVYACIATFIFALPASALLIGIGEWKRLGARYYVVAGFLAATLSWLAAMTDVYLRAQRGDDAPWLRPDDVPMLLSVGVGGLVGGFVFACSRTMLVRRLGDLGFLASEPEHL
jgi:hypothetical protein